MPRFGAYCAGLDLDGPRCVSPSATTPSTPSTPSAPCWPGARAGLDAWKSVSHDTATAG